VVSRGRASVALFALATAVAALGCASSDVERTEILLVVDSDLAVPDELDELAMHIEGPGGVVQDAVAKLAEAPLPRSLGLVRKQGALSPLNIQVTGRVAGRAIVQRTATLAFVEGRTLVLPLHLVRSCVSRACGEQTCSERGCVDVALDPQSLAEWSGREPTLDVPSEGFDAGTLDASAPEADAAPRDGGALLLDGAARDGGSDAARDAAGDGARGDGGSCQPTMELCNGVDDDCDGTADDGFRLSDDPSNCGRCGNVCSGATRVCCSGRCSTRC